MDLSVIIVNYNVQYFLEQCLQSVFISGEELSMEVFVVDNNSVDGSLEMVREKFPQVHLIANKENVGFSRANNQALKLATGRYTLLLNPDTVVEHDTFTKVVDFMDHHPEAGALGVKMLDGKGRFLPESKRGLPTPMVAFYKIFGLSALFPRSRTFGRYHLGYLDNDKIHSVEILAGAFMLIRRQALQKTGLLDEDFFMYGEDIDLSYRILKAGYRNYYYPDTRIIHYKGESTKKSSINYVFVFYNAMIIFARKHFSPKNAGIFSLLIKMAIYFRAFMAILSRFFRRVSWPVLDTSVIYLGLYYIINYWEHQIFRADTPYYPPEFLYGVVPVYIMFWLAATYISGGYDRPVKLFDIVKGIGLGTIAILVIYALLPISLRFSRAIILLGSAWALASMIMVRVLSFMIRHKSIYPGEENKKRILIVGDGKETARIAQMVRQAGRSAFIGLISLKQEKPHEGGYIGTIHNMEQIIEIYRIEEIIFCGGDISSQTIIDQMSLLKDHPVDFKIAPPESLYIIGSNSIDTFGDLFTININAINKPVNKRNKRIFDLSMALLLIFTLPLHLLLIKNRWSFVKNLTGVFASRKSWVGYHSSEQAQKLPPLKSAVLHPGDLFDSRPLDKHTLSNLNNLYAKEYKIETDLNIFLKGYRKLGRSVN
ncbi:MAG: glycosyltransferase [Bacteroidales bacterium]